MPQIYENSTGNYYYLPENHPAVSLIYILLFAFVGAIVFTIIGLILAFAIGGGNLADISNTLSGRAAEDVHFLRIVQTSSSIGAFIIPAWFLQKIEAKRTTYFHFERSPSGLLWLLVPLLMLSVSPLLELSAFINEQMKLPASLSGIEAWMKDKEGELTRLTHVLLQGTAYPVLLFNLFMMAVLPAIGEELVFRGILQNIFIRWTRQTHLGVWLTAIIFSAIHLQFYGFLPRMLMGALFGYLFLWSKNIWLPILAHFINNATVVIYGFILQKQGKSLDALNEPQHFPIVLYIISLVATTAILYYIWKQHRESKTYRKTLEATNDGSQLD